MKAYGIKVDIKDRNLKTISRQKQLITPTHLALDIRKAAMEIIKKSWNMDEPIRLLTVTAINLCDEDEEEQLSLFAGAEQDKTRKESMEKTMDEIRRKFGSGAITFGQVINNDIGIDL